MPSPFGTLLGQEVETIERVWEKLQAEFPPSAPRIEMLKGMREHVVLYGPTDPFRGLWLSWIDQKMLGIRRKNREQMKRVTAVLATL